MNRHIMMTLDVAHANVDALRAEARMSRPHGGTATIDRIRSITGRRRTR